MAKRTVITNAEKKAQAASEAAAKKLAAKLAKATPDKAGVAAAGAAAAREAASRQAEDNKQSKTMGVVARGKTVKNQGVYKRQGEFVHASRAEIEDLRSRGFLVDEGRIAIPMGARGPQVLIEDAASKGAREPA